MRTTRAVAGARATPHRKNLDHAASLISFIESAGVDARSCGIFWFPSLKAHVHCLRGALLGLSKRHHQRQLQHAPCPGRTTPSWRFAGHLEPWRRVAEPDCEANLEGTPAESRAFLKRPQSPSFLACQGPGQSAEPKSASVRQRSAARARTRCEIDPYSVSPPSRCRIWTLRSLFRSHLHATTESPRTSSRRSRAEPPWTFRAWVTLSRRILRRGCSIRF